MTRPPRLRTVRHVPGAAYFAPRGVSLRVLAEVILGLDELEALRLADMEGLPQEEVGRRMNVSRQTAGRILGRARGKVAQALVMGRAIRIEGGPVVPPASLALPWPPPGGGPVGPARGLGRGRRRGHGGRRRGGGRRR